MKKSTLSLLSLLLAAIMLLGMLASCAGGAETTAETTVGTTESNTVTSATEKTEESGTSTTEVATTNTPSDESEEQSTTANDKQSESESAETESETDSATDSSSESETTTESETESTDNGEVLLPEYTLSNEKNIENANALKNGVNAYFTDGRRTDFVLENQNMTLEYALTAGKNQQITSLVNKDGNAYVKDTCDVFVKMTDGNVFYASGSTKPATANLYRLGYYMYEARFEEQNFMGEYSLENALPLSLQGATKNQVRTETTEDGNTLVTVNPGKTPDPYLLLKNVSYSAASYPYVAITLKANVKSARGLTVYLSTDSHSMGSAQGVTISPSDEFMTYYVPLFRTSWYKGTVTGFRLDFAENSIKGETYEIKDVRLIDGITEGIPQKLGLNRSFFIYSDKLHHVLQIATDSVATEGIASVGMETKIAKDTVAKVVVKDKNGVKTSFDGIDWDSAEYVGFDIIGTGIFGYILPAGEKTDKLEVIDNGSEYVIIQSRAPENGTIKPSGVYNIEAEKYDALVDDNANDFYMGQRIYTDGNHDFDAFLHEAFVERNPLGKDNFVLNKRDSSYEATYECPLCGEDFDSYATQCPACYEKITPIENATIYFKGYDPLRGLYSYHVPSEGFSAPYFQYPNKYIDLTFKIIGDEYDRSIYFMASSTSGCLECAAILDENRMLLPIPVEVGKNFSEGSGERNLWNIQDNLYGESIIPILVEAKESYTFTMLNLYQNWGQYPLKQVSWIQFYAPYYHLSTGVTESNCIVPYYSCKNARGLGTLPDHRAMSAHLWSGQPQHTSGGGHRWLIYTDADGIYSASENTLDYIDSYGPVYADVFMDFLSDDGNIKVSYTHMEFPQTDENRAYYEMKYEVLGDVSFADFSRDFCFYDVNDNDSKGSYKKVGYLNADNQPTIVDSTAKTGKSAQKYVLGTECPYFSFFDMPDYNQESTSAEGFTNLSFLIYNYELIINGEKSDARFAIINEEDRVRLSLDLGETTLKAGDSFVINAIVMPWGDENLDYSVVGDKNVRDVRENTLLNPLTPKAVENCEVLESVFLPRVKSTNGKNATFNLKGGQNNVAVRVYGFSMLTVPKIEELVGDEWVEYKVSSAWKPDKYDNAHYYDGYSVHYDADGTFSYSFIVPMDYTDADGRTFRVSCDTPFEGWPKKLPDIPKEEVELPLNVFVNAQEIHDAARNQAGKWFGGIKMADDGSYVTLSSNVKRQEIYFNVWNGDGGKTVTGQYFVLRYRLPSTNNKPYSGFEIFTNTVDVETSKSCFYIGGAAFINDGEWHTLVIDFASFEKDVFVPDANNEYRARFVRFDLYNDFYPDGNSIDIEFFGISDNLEDIRNYETVSIINVYTKGGEITSYDKEGNEVDGMGQGGSEGGIQDATSAVPGFNVYLDPNSLTASGKNTLWKDTISTGTEGEQSFTTVKNYVNAASNDHKLETYFSVYSGTGKATGQYAVIKYRANVQQGSITLWTSTEKASPSSGNNFDLNEGNGLFIADNEWHIVIVDLSKLISTYTANEGKYVATHLRVDFFNFGKVRDSADTVAQVDVAYIGLCDDFAEILCSDKTVEEIIFYNGQLSKYSTATGELTEGEGAPEPEPEPEPVFTKYFNATSIIEASQVGGGHAGKSELIDGKIAKLYNCTDPNKSNQFRIESYFSLFSANTEVTGQYLVMKYRANIQVGCIQIYTSTQDDGAKESGTLYLENGNGLFTADGEWHIVIIDLSKATGTFTENSNGKFVAKYLRIDLFNFGSPRTEGETAYVELEYVGLSANLEKAITNDQTVSKVTFYDGALGEFSTSGDAIKLPNFIINAAALSGQTEGTGLDRTLSADSSYTSYTLKSGASDAYSYVIRTDKKVNVPSAPTGQYLKIKYKTTYTGSWTVYLGANNGSVSATGQGDKFSLTQKNGTAGAIVSDGEWQYLIIDLASLYESAGMSGFQPENGTTDTYIIDYFRFGFWPSASTPIDIAYVAIADSLDKLVGYDSMTSYTYVASYSNGVINETVTK